MDSILKRLTKLAGPFAITLLVSSAALLGSGCNTTEGAGRDIEALGDSIEDAASDAKD